MLTPQLEEKGLHDRIVQGWLVSVHMDVDEQDRPHPEAEEGNAKEPEAGPSTTLLEKLALKVDKLEADMAEVLANQQYIIHLLTHPT